MKKSILTLAFILAVATQSFAMDSTALSNSKILGTSIQQGASVTPVGTVITWASDKMPNDGAGVWLECDGRAIPSDAKYQDLRDYLMSDSTPNYTNQFLRGGTSAQVGQTASDSIRSHAHGMDQHQHTVSGSAGAQTYQAPAAGGSGYVDAKPAGRYVYLCTSWFGYADDSTMSSNVAPYSGRHPSMGPGLYADVCPTHGSGWDAMGKLLYENAAAGGGGSTTAHTSGGPISGLTNTAGPTSTHAYGATETAPQHIRVRYLIRALP